MKKIASFPASSTSVMLPQLLSEPLDSPDSADSQLIYQTTLLMEETDPAEINIIKSSIVALFKWEDANLLTPLPGSNVLHRLMTYYRRSGEKDYLYQIVTNFYWAYEFRSVCLQLFQQRWQGDTKMRFKYAQSDYGRESAFLNDSVRLRLACKNIAEATLAAQMLETLLYEKYGIPFRSATKSMPISFIEHPTDSGIIHVIACFAPTDYLKIAKPLQLTIKDELLTRLFRDSRRDFYDYCQIKYNIKNTRGMNVSHEHLAPHHIAIADDSNDNLTTQTFSGKLLIVTRTGLGSGNYINARLTIEGICRLMPQITINWVVATDGDPLPPIQQLPPQVTLHETDTLWKFYPVIRSLSLDADVVASLPNAFLCFTENDLLNTQLTLSQKSVFIMLNEYNTSYDLNEVPPYYLNLPSGINAGEGSLGLIKPSTLTLPSELTEKRTLLCQNEKAATLFIDEPNAPLYFGYAYQAKIGVMSSTVQGVRIIDTLALFIQHAKLSHHNHIKIVLPIDMATIQEARHVYPSIFSECTICYTNSISSFEMVLGSKIYVEVFDTFPFDNTVFRQLMDYAAAHNNPIVITGDQSLMEPFFTITQGFVFIYQLLQHKQKLLAQIKSIAADKQLLQLKYLITHTENGIKSECDLIALTEFILTNQDELKQESLQLATALKAQPNLAEALAIIIVKSVDEKRRALADMEEPLEPNITPPI